jgi:hypothetical protein
MGRDADVKKRSVRDALVVALLMIAGFGVTGNLDSPAAYGFCVLFGVLFAGVRWAYRRHARRGPAAGR